MISKFKKGFYRIALILLIGTPLCAQEMDIKETVRKGDSLFYVGNYTAAYNAYEAASDQLPASKSIQQRKVNTFAHTEATPEQIFEQCNTLSSYHLNDIGSNALESLMASYDYEKDTKVSKWTIVWWLEYRNQLGPLSYKTMERLPLSWRESDHFAELLQLTNSGNPHVSLRTWEDMSPLKISPELTLIPQFVMAETLNNLGDQYYQKGDAKNALLYYEAAYNMIGKKDHPMALLNDREEMPDILLTVMGNLGILYSLSDSTSQKFGELEDMLFRGKGQAYLQMDNNSIRKFHTTLGLIYASMGKWSGGRYTNAEFQLVNAIKKSPKGVHLGYLQQTLAYGFEKELNEPDKASFFYAEASKSYLNSDNLGQAESLVSKARNVNGNPANGLSQLNQIIKIRREILVMSPEELSNTRNIEQHLKKIFSNFNEDEEFSAIQRFKIYSDISQHAIEQNLKDASIHYSGKALSEAKKVKAIYTDSDVKRIENAQKNLYGYMDINTDVNRSYVIHPDKAANAKEDSKTWEIYQQGSTPTILKVDYKSFEIVDFSEELERKKIKPSQDPNSQFQKAVKKENMDLIFEDMRKP